MKKIIFLSIIVFGLLIICANDLESAPKKKTAPKEQKSVNSIDSKLDDYQSATNKYCEMMRRQNNGENVYEALNNATMRFAELNQELSGMIEDKKFSRKQYDRFVKITDQYSGCM